MKPLSMGILGLGEGRSVISAVLASPDWKLGGICDLKEELCKKRAEEFGLTGYTLRYEDLLEDPDIDVIGIDTPDPLHAEHIRMALEAGKHVVCTKPLTVSLEGARELMEVQRRTGKTVFVGQSSRYFEAAMHQRRDFEAGKNGELVTVETSYISDSRWFLERDWSHRPGFSWMYNFLIHAVDLAVWYLPRVEEVVGFGVTSSNSSSLGVEANDALKFLLRDASGVTASVTGAYAIPALAQPVEHFITCTLRGTMGASKADCPFDYGYHFSEPGKFKHTERENYEEKRAYYYRFEGETHHAGEYQNYLEDFARCLREGRTPKPDLREGFRTIAVMETMERSLRTGQVERVSETLRERGLEDLENPADA